MGLVRPDKVCLYVEQMSTVQATAAIPKVVGFGHGVVGRSLEELLVRLRRSRPLDGNGISRYCEEQ